MMIKLTSKSIGDCLRSTGVLVNDGSGGKYYNLQPTVWIYEDADKNLFICGKSDLPPVAQDIIEWKRRQFGMGTPLPMF